MNPTFSVRNVYGDHMAFQRGRPIRVVGTAPANTGVTVRFAGRDVVATAAEDGAWEAVFPAMEAGGPYELSATSAAGATVVFCDVVVGDVWFCSGQSNMEYPVLCDNYFFSLRDGKEVAERANDPGLRLFQVPRAIGPDGPCDNVPPGCAWRPATTPEAVKPFSAVGYWFGVFMRQERGDVPVGVINASWGATNIEPWIDRQAFETAGRTLELRLVDALRFNPASDQAKPADRNSLTMPTVLYNGMVHPFTVMPVRGFVWYQGCSNTGDPETYRILHPLLLESWRRAFHSPEAAFLVTQLAGFEQHRPDDRLPDDYWKAIEPQDGGYPRVREVQAGMRSYPNTGVAVAIDIGDPFDIHPHNKKDVAFRLAKQAERISYGYQGVVEGPLYDSMRIEGNRIRVSFTNLGGGLVAHGGAVGEHSFAVAGADDRYVWADARVEGDTVVVWSDAVPAPVNVRYAWGMCPPNPNLYNAEGFPAFPFRTDSDPA